MLMLAFLVLISLPFVHMARGTLPDYHPFAIAMPALSLFSLNVFGKLAMGALSGFEYVAVLAGETKDPERTIGRATIIAAPIIAAMFILGTSAVLAFVPIDQINLIGPIPQVLRIGFGATGAGTIAAAIAILLITGRTVAELEHRVHGDDSHADGRRLGQSVCRNGSRRFTRAIERRSIRFCSLDSSRWRSARSGSRASASRKRFNSSRMRRESSTGSRIW